MECIEILEETLISGVLINIRSETSDTKSEVDVPDEETLDSTEVMHFQKHWHWLMWWCSVSSWSITVPIIGVGIRTKPHHRLTVLRLSLNMPSSKHLPDMMENEFYCHFPEVCVSEHSQ